MRYCKDCDIFKNANRYEICSAGHGCGGLDFDCDVDHEDIRQIWCEEVECTVCESNIMCQNRLNKRELIELLLSRTLRIANELHDIRQTVTLIDSRQQLQDKEKEKEKWERERPLRIANYEKMLAELPEWVSPQKASCVTGLKTSTLATYEKNGVLKCRRNDKGHREYWKNDLVSYTEKVKECIKSAQWGK